MEEPSGPEKTPEEKAKEMEANMKLASQNNDPSTALQWMALMQMKDPKDTAIKALGIFRYYYYYFYSQYHHPPIDFTELVDGVLYSEVQRYGEKYYMQVQRVSQKK